jgi:ABC-type transport system involved in multi-copper enzyme maturation permease subunit
MAFQATSAVAHESERSTLDFLLLLPVERSYILLIKWVAPWIRQRTLLFATFAIPLIGMVSTMFPPRSALLMLLLPWPPLLLINTLGMYLSVVCKRTVTANILLVAILVGVFILHVLAWDAFGMLLQGYGNLLVEDRHAAMDQDIHHAQWMVLGHQGLMLTFAGLFAYLAFWRFNAKTAG